MAHDATAVVAALRALIAREAEALRRGAFAELPQLAQRKAALTEALAEVADAAGADALAGLRAASEANARLLQAALRGLAAARARLAAIRQAGVQLDTYDCHGRARRLVLAAGRVERRA